MTAWQRHRVLGAFRYVFNEWCIKVAIASCSRRVDASWIVPETLATTRDWLRCTSRCFYGWQRLRLERHVADGSEQVSALREHITSARGERVGHTTRLLSWLQGNALTIRLLLFSWRNAVGQRHDEERRANQHDMEMRLELRNERSFSVWGYDRLMTWCLQVLLTWRACTLWVQVATSRSQRGLLIGMFHSLRTKFFATALLNAWRMIFREALVSASQRSQTLQSVEKLRLAQKQIAMSAFSAAVCQAKQDHSQSSSQGLLLRCRKHIHNVMRLRELEMDIACLCVCWMQWRRRVVSKVARKRDDLFHIIVDRTEKGDSVRLSRIALHYWCNQTKWARACRIRLRANLRCAFCIWSWGMSEARRSEAIEAATQFQQFRRADAFRLLSSQLRSENVCNTRLVFLRWTIWTNKARWRLSQHRNVHRLVDVGLRVSTMLEVGVALGMWRHFTARRRAEDVLKRAALKVDQVIVEKDSMSAQFIEQAAYDLKSANVDKENSNLRWSIQSQRRTSRRDAQFANILSAWCCEVTVHRVDAVMRAWRSITREGRLSAHANRLAEMMPRIH